MRCARRQYAETRLEREQNELQRSFLEGWESASAISTRGHRVILKHLAKPGLHDFAGRGMRQLFQYDDIVGQHPARKAFAEKCEEIAALRPASRSWRHD